MKTNLYPSQLLLLALLVLASCKSQRYTPAQMPDNQVIFGDGGGFTGAVTRYILLENGQLFKHYSLDDSMTDLGSISKREARAYFKEIENLQLAQKQISQPGNVYYFLEYRSGDQTARSTWGDVDYQLDPSVLEMHQKLLAQLRQMKGIAK
ncbi:MAG TPA: hypothetical protein PKC76_18175 [Saprospiraceae bacterium]|nr:hypothetical protein [Saprospiraceae bacterium]HMP26061.1 hypothetical protein [Saprospiraceae bacterium]